MPKQVWKIERFDGGLNTNSDPRDIADNELAEATDIMVDNVGKIRTMGGTTAHDAAASASGTISAGYGLFQFSHDRLGASTTGTGQAETGDDYLAFGDTDTSANLDIYSRVADEAGGTGWGGSVVDLGSVTGMEPCFYQADGALRVSDGSFVGNQNKWYGYIEQTHFNGISPGGAADAYDGWYVKSLDLAAPTDGIYGENFIFTSSGGSTTTVISGSNKFDYYGNIDGRKYVAVSTDNSNEARIITEKTSGTTLTTEANSGNYSGEAIVLYPPAGAGWNVYIKSDSSNAGSWTVGRRRLGSTFIYQNGQESKIYDIGNYDFSAGIASLTSGQAIDVKIYATSPFDPFIIGGRIYIRDFYSDDSWVFVADISLKEGARSDLTSDYTAWTLQDAGGNGDAILDSYCSVDLDRIENPSPWTYEKINGYNPDESIDIGAVGQGFKTAVVANRQTYIGNVRRVGKDGVIRTEGDAMYKSMPGKFDTFPIARKIEASVQDGDQIVKLEEYADRILQFKKTKMHLINISQDVEFLEDTFMHKGVSHPASVCKTDFGIAWANREGCYLYDGKNVINLLEKKGRQIVKESEWNNFLTADKDGTGALCTPMVGYLPKKRQIIVFDDITNTSTTNPRMYLYDMVTQSWVQGANDGARLIDILKTNFVTDWNGDLVYAHTSGTMVKWDDTSDVTDTISFKTKDIDFGNPAVRKKVYKAYISYKGDGDSVTIQYSINGDTDTVAPFYRTTADGSSDKTNSDTTPLLDSNTDDWILAELRPVTSINNVYSFQLIFDGTAGLDFEINDISIVYRIKNIK